MATSYWWVCRAPGVDHPRCGDQMAESDRKEAVIEDQSAHIAAQHPDWHPTERELGIDHWTER